MAIVQNNSQNQNESNSTNVLAPTQGESNGEQGSNYVSNGNPYGNHSSSSGVITSGTTPSTVAKPQQSSLSKSPSQGASSGSFTNVQTYVDKNQGSSKNLANAASKTLTNTADIAKENLNKVNQNYQNQVASGSLQNKGTALQEANTAYNEAANQKAATQNYYQENQAYLYDPTTSGSAEDNALKSSGKAKAVFGDGTSKEYNTAAEANDAINAYNNQTSDYYQYGDEQALSVNDKRLADILNAEYKGPTDLSEASGYEDAYNTFQDAAALQDNALNKSNQDELLNRTFSTGQNEYGQGSRLLDSLLLGQGEANDIFKNTAQNLGTTESGLLNDQLKQAQKDANKLAQNETQELRDLRSQARADLNTVANQRQSNVDSRLNTVVDNWEQYPQYFRDLFQNSIDEYKLGKEGKAAYDKIGNTYNNAKKQVDAITQKYGDIGQYSDILNKAKESNGILNRVEELRKIISNPAQYANRDSNGSYNSSLRNAQSKLRELTSSDEYKNANNYVKQANELTTKYNTDLNALLIASDIYNTNKATMNTHQSDYDKYSKYANFDPKSFNASLSEAEASMLGIKGGEGLYNLLQDSINGTSGTNTIDNLLKTADYDKNKLISRDEQSQLARLQSIAQMANNYGSANSGIDYKNNYTNRDAAGTQSSLDALDMNNFANLVQGAEKNFRDDATSSNITGYGYGTGKSSGAFGSKTKSASRTYSQNFADLIGDNYRNMYDSDGIDKALINDLISSAQGKQVNQTGNTIGDDVIGQTVDFTSGLGNMLSSGSSNDVVKGATDYMMWSNPVTAPIMLAKSLGNSLLGNSSKAQARADQAAHNNAVANLQANLDKKIQSSGVNNQFSVQQNAERDALLAKILGQLDSTNL